MGQIWTCTLFSSTAANSVHLGDHPGDKVWNCLSELCYEEPLTAPSDLCQLQPGCSQVWTLPSDCASSGYCYSLCIDMYRYGNRILAFTILGQMFVEQTPEAMHTPIWLYLVQNWHGYCYSVLDMAVRVSTFTILGQNICGAFSYKCERLHACTITHYKLLAHGIFTQ